jgi:TetR/AcrR family transcriptional regulator, tetracycline repressor protein
VVVEEKSKLTREVVVAQALAMADADGLEAVTVRRLADRLGVTPMALYWHVKGKDELLMAMADQLLAEVTPTRNASEPWPDQLRAMITALLRVMRAHPCAPALLATADKAQVESFTRATEVALGLLREAGFSLQEGFVIASQLLHDVIGLVDRQPMCAPGPDLGMAGPKAEGLRGLPASRYPLIVEYMNGPRLDPENYYAFGLDLLISGVVALADRRTNGATR